MIRVLELIGEQKAPNFQKNARMDVQCLDNWRVVKKFMECVPARQTGAWQKV